MPRPKRSKVAPSVPIKLPHQRVPQPAVTASAAQKQRDLFSPASSGRITNASDDSDGLVVAKKGGRAMINTTPQQYTMSGALAFEDIGTTRLKPPSGKTRAELTRIIREADHAQAMEEARARGAKAQVTATEEPEQIPSSIPTKPASIRKNESNSSARESLAHEGAQVRVPIKAQETPRMQSSILGGAAFKKRPRQPSLLQMISSQNQTQIEPDHDDDDMYNFLPDDESTPLIKSLSQPPAQRSSSSSVRTSGSRKRKQVTPELQVPASQSQSTLPRSSPSSAPLQSMELPDPYDLSAQEDQPQPTLPRHRSTQTLQPQIQNELLAPPQSDSPAKPTKPAKASRKTKPRSQQSTRKEAALVPSPLLSISTHVSPIRPAKTKPLSTATLQNLLPRRRVRRKPKGDYDMPSSSDVELDNTGLGEDEDELSFHAIKVRRKKSGMNVAKGAAKSKGGATKKIPKTYARKSLAISDDDDDISSAGEEGDEDVVVGKKKNPALDGKAKAEMKRLADKFREVDEFTLDFEDMTGSSSQMKDAR